MAQRFDATDGSLRGEAVQVASGIASSPVDGAVALSVAGPGVLAYASRPRPPIRELVWVDRAGRHVGAAGAPDHYAGFSLSPDGRYAVLERAETDQEPAAPDLWALDLARGIQSQLTDTPGNDEGAVWTSDARRFAYARHRGLRQRADLYLKDVREPDKDQPLLVDEAGSKHPFDFSPDSRLLLYGLAQPKSARQDIWALPLEGDGAPFPWLATPFNEAEARFSPDGRWVAYESDETGPREIVVRAFGSSTIRAQVSLGGGTRPEWSPNGRELYYVSADYHLMAVSLRLGAVIEPDTPRPLFEIRRLERVPSWPTPYAVSPDGQRFLVGAVVDEGSGSPMSVVLNWTRLFDR
jgi:dipeptidyl aminopeptidase/acylaminoacyl peptidase